MLHNYYLSVMVILIYYLFSEIILPISQKEAL